MSQCGRRSKLTVAECEAIAEQWGVSLETVRHISAGWRPKKPRVET